MRPPWVPAQLERPPCPLCGTDAPRVAYAWSEHPYQVVRCGACRFLYLSPRPAPAALAELYRGGGYWEGAGYEDYAAQEATLRATARGLLGRLARRGLGGRLLEVGCGWGYLLDEARPWFSPREGTELDPVACARARQHADAIHAGGVEAIPPGARYDLIVSSQVVEHVTDPLAFLRGQASHLAPGGAVVVVTPDAGSAWRRALGRRWPSFKLPEHLLYFDRRSLTGLLQRAGLPRVERLPYPHAFPLGELGRKLGLGLPGRLSRVGVWLPGTCLALLARPE